MKVWRIEVTVPVIIMAKTEEEAREKVLESEELGQAIHSAFVYDKDSVEEVECAHANVSEYFERCDDCGADVPFDPYNCDFNNPASAAHY